MKNIMHIEPYELMEIISKVGDGAIDEFGNDRINKMMSKIRQSPSIPLTLQCNTSSTFDYQNIDDQKSNDTLLNRYRNLKILQMLGLTPGDTRPALEIFKRLLENVISSENIMWFNETTSEIWNGDIKSDSYEKGIKMGIEAIIPNVRSKKMRVQVKEESVNDLYNEKIILIRPHHLMCMACCYRGPDDLTPLDEDNIFEIIGIMREKPEASIKLVEGTTCLICVPCQMFDPTVNKCTGDVGISLRDELKDLYVLRKLGLKYGDIIPAKELYELLFERIESASEICSFGEEKYYSREWRPCDLTYEGAYEKTRKTGMIP
jgi:hypothetical protein